jgi:hypothetical protein
MTVAFKSMYPPFLWTVRWNDSISPICATWANLTTKGNTQSATLHSAMQPICL